MILADAFINPEVIFVLIALLASAIKAYFDRKAGRNQEEDEDGDVYDEYRELILQRQRQARAPETAGVVPPPLPPKAEKSHRPPPVPSDGDRAPELSPLQKMAARGVEKPRLSAREKEALARVQQQRGSGSKRRRAASPTGSVRAMLSHPGSARKAVILSEILGPPKSLHEN
ncbi:MAG: hypothetical protein ACQKBY_03715 [Verrucomicrobiales bacterium]